VLNGTEVKSLREGRVTLPQASRRSATASDGSSAFDRRLRRGGHANTSRIGRSKLMPASRRDRLVYGKVREQGG